MTSLIWAEGAEEKPARESRRADGLAVAAQRAKGDEEEDRGRQYLQELVLHRVPELRHDVSVG